MSASEVERILSEEIIAARIRNEEANAELRDLENDVSAKPPHPDGAYLINEAFEARRKTRADLANALDHFNNFLLYGSIPAEGPPRYADRSRICSLEAALFGLYQAWARLPMPPNRLRSYRAEKFRQMIVPGCKLYRGGIGAARHMLNRSESRLLAHLTMYNRMDLSIEALVLSGYWDDLFSPQDRERAAHTLARA